MLTAGVGGIPNAAIRKQDGISPFLLDRLTEAIGFEHVAVEND